MPARASQEEMLVLCKERGGQTRPKERQGMDVLSKNVDG